MTEKQLIALKYINNQGSVSVIKNNVNKNTLKSLYDKNLIESWLSINGDFWEITDLGIKVLMKNEN